MIRSYYLPKPEVHSPAATETNTLASRWLPQSALDYATRYCHPARQLSYFCTRLLIRYSLSILTGESPADFRISRATQGGGLMASLRDQAANDRLAHVDFSITHGQTAVGLVISDRPAMTVGMDIESRERRVSAIGLARRYFQPSIATWVAKHPTPDDAFLQIWTQAEALVKAAKTGMGNNTQSMRFILDDEAAYLANQQLLRAGLLKKWQSFSGLLPAHRWSIVIGYPEQAPSLTLTSLTPARVELDTLLNYPR